MGLKWLMELNINKCTVISITLKRNYIFHENNILGKMLKRVTNHDYLGVTISSDRSCLRHAKKNSNKASKTLGLLKRTLSPCSQKVLLPTKCLFAPNMNMPVKSGARIQCNVFRKLNKFKEIHLS